VLSLCHTHTHTWAYGTYTYTEIGFVFVAQSWGEGCGRDSPGFFLGSITSLALPFPFCVFLFFIARKRERERARNCSCSFRHDVEFECTRYWLIDWYCIYSDISYDFVLIWNRTNFICRRMLQGSNLYIFH